MADIHFSFSAFGSATNLNSTATQGTIASGVLTLNGAESLVNVGDHFRFGTIHVYSIQKNSDTEHVVRSADGSVPADVGPVALSWIRREYDSLALLEAGFTDLNHINNLDLTATGANVSVGANGYVDHVDGTLDTTQVSFSGHTTDATHNIIVIGDAVNDGVYDNSTYYALEYTAIANNDVGITINDAYTEFNYFQTTLINSGGFTGVAAIDVTASNVTLESSLIVGSISAALSEGIGLQISTGASSVIANNLLIYDFVNGTTACYGVVSGVANALDLSYTTIQNCRTGVNNSTASGMQARNVLTQDCNTDAAGTFAASSNYNLTDIASGSSGFAGQANSVFNTTLTFNNKAANDFHVAAGDTAARAGTPITGRTLDIDGNFRSGTTPWIGFDEGAAAPVVGGNNYEHTWVKVGVGI